MEKTQELLANGKVFRSNFEPIASMNEEEPDKTTLKTQKSKSKRRKSATNHRFYRR